MIKIWKLKKTHVIKKLIKSKYPRPFWITRNIFTIILNIEEKSYLRHSEGEKRRENKTWPRRRVTISFLAHQLHQWTLCGAKEPQRDEPRADPSSILGSENVSAVSISLLARIDARHKLNWKHEDPQSIAWRSRETWSNLNIKGTSWPNRNLNDGWGSSRRSRWGLHRFIWFIPKNWIAADLADGHVGIRFAIDSQHPSWRSSICINGFLIKRVTGNRRGGPFRKWNSFREKFVGPVGWEKFSTPLRRKHLNRLRDDSGKGRIYRWEEYPLMCIWILNFRGVRKGSWNN